jgi:hypothetical protein
MKNVLPWTRRKWYKSEIVHFVAIFWQKSLRYKRLRVKIKHFADNKFPHIDFFQSIG